MEDNSSIISAWNQTKEKRLREKPSTMFILIYGLLVFGVAAFAAAFAVFVVC